MYMGVYVHLVYCSEICQQKILVSQSKCVLLPLHNKTTGLTF